MICEMYLISILKHIIDKHTYVYIAVTTEIHYLKIY